ncbi:MAG: gluconokinase [Deltaproteobacteria bacterium]|nr:gluconokinase [Deltaproteobacteria bacterium]MBW2123587.1 gluconokinase [Deltaproteobacteria bacterium]
MDPAAYPERPGSVSFTETHISLVFFTGAHAYKVKKPVNFGFLDFTTLDKRKHFCQLELNLNRRLSRDIYLAVVPIRKKGGRVVIDGEGRTVEYAVKMKQIPEDLLMDRLLDRGMISREMVERVADRLVDFYGKTETNERIQSFARPNRLRQDTDENFEQTEKYIGTTVSGRQFREIRGATDSFLERNRQVFLQRIREGRIRDCHGDLRLEHVFFGQEISILDCIEFNERFRYIDIAADIGFLAMDLDYRGRGDLSRVLIDRYVNRFGDPGIYRVLDFYKCYRAYVRGKVESFTLDDPHVDTGEKERALDRALEYFRLSHQYAGMLS